MEFEYSELRAFLLNLPVMDMDQVRHAVGWGHFVDLIAAVLSACRFGTSL